MANYKEWYQIGSDNRYFSRYLKERDIQMEKSRIALEQAFRPELRKMLEDRLNDKPK